MVKSKEDLTDTLPVTEEDREELQSVINDAIAAADIGVYSVRVVGEPNREGTSEYAVAILMKTGE